MNKLNVYHSDIKADNILIDLNDSQLKIIDWGLSTIYCSYNFVSMLDGLAPFNSRFSFPKKWRDRSLSFNVPFSNIMFSDFFEYELSVFMSESPRNKTLVNCKIFIEIFLENFLKYRTGHSLYIERICSIVFDNKIGYKSVIINYNSKILHKYITSNTNTLGLLKYANTVYKQNVDVWGFVMTYAPILQGYHITKKNLTPELRRVFNKLKKIFITHLYRTHVNPINVESLVNDLQEINTLYRKIEAPIKKETSNKKPSKTKKTTTSKLKKTTTSKLKKTT
jgi:serine/threonine protein kinase